MIAVFCKDSERKVVAEFFELFKTPWEFYEDDQAYDVVVATKPGLPPVTAGLLILCGSFVTESDQQLPRPRSLRAGVPVVFRGNRIPLLHEVLCFEPGNCRVVCSTGAGELAGVQCTGNDRTIVRLGYNLFTEIESLLRDGQPLEHAVTPTIELHIAMLRQLILDAGIPVLEIAPSPFGYDFSVCLTHDIDFVGIRRHLLDHTMWGFLLRATLGSVIRLARGTLSFNQFLQSWKAALSLPLVYLGLVPDFWMRFDWFMKVEKGLSPTYFFIPFKRRAGQKLNMANASRRASAYDISDIPELASQLLQHGCELGVHGIDAWHDVKCAREERKRLAAVTGPVEVGIRMHWLVQDKRTCKVLDEAGYDFDSTAGYNESPGYKCGTTQVFKPLNVDHLLELPLHIQDGALFFSKRMGLAESQAWELCKSLIENARRFGGVLTLLWHDRSPGPERFWGDFYMRLVADLKKLKVWFARGSEAVGWFRRRREITFERAQALDGSSRFKLSGIGRRVNPPFKVRIYSPAVSDSDFPQRKADPAITELAWDGDTEIELGTDRPATAEASMGVLAISTCE